MIDKKAIEEHIRGILVALGDDPNREGLIDTPKRVAQMYEEVFEGMNYTNEEIAHMFDKTFSEDYRSSSSDVVLVKDINVFSYCEHHMALMYDMKALYQAESVQDAVALRVAHPDAQIIAGGSDVLVQMREGKRAGVELISIYGLDELRGVTLEADGTLRIGSLTSFSHITRDPLIQKYLHVLGEAVDQVGGPQIRNIGTIGGNTCNGVTSADSASTLHAYDAIVELTGPDGIRRQPIREFYIRAGKVDIRPGEIQTAILIEKDSYIDTFGHYIKYAMRNAMDIATLGTSVNVRLSADKKTVERARVAFGVAGPVPLRAAAAEELAAGQPVSLELADRFAQAVKEDINPRDSWRAAKDFRMHIAVESARRAFIEAVKLAGGDL